MDGNNETNMNKQPTAPQNESPNRQSMEEDDERTAEHELKNTDADDSHIADTKNNTQNMQNNTQILFLQQKNTNTLLTPNIAQQQTENQIQNQTQNSSQSQKQVQTALQITSNSLSNFCADAPPLTITQKILRCSNPSSPPMPNQLQQQK